MANIYQSMEELIGKTPLLKLNESTQIKGKYSG